MHWMQGRRRRTLRRRVADGEVDLEALGIKRLTVPQEVLDNMPLYTYGSVVPVRPDATTIVPLTTVGADKDGTTSVSSSRPGSPVPTARPTPALVRSSSYHPTAYQQPTCAICLDDFIAPDSDANEPGTIVRELPCHHIFHPDCVDTFLRDNSSLCPMCKKTALPKGYCPANVTNAMVRRERMIRRLRDRVTVGSDDAIQGDRDPETQAYLPHQSLTQRIRTRTFSPLSALSPIGRRISSAPVQSNQRMTDLSSPPAPRRSATSVLGQPQPASTAGRREWARQRAIVMLGRHPAPVDPDAEDAARTSRWRKMLGNVFPAIDGR
jgi:hypothetical protein